MARTRQLPDFTEELIRWRWNSRPTIKSLAAASEGEARAANTRRGAQGLRVRVRNNTNFRTGMKLPACRAVDDANGLWELPGKMPRQPGRW